MKFLRVIFFTIFLCLSMLSAALAVTQHDHVTYEISTGETLTMQWDAVEDATVYDVQLLRHDWGNEVVQEWLEITVVEQAFTPPKTGTYVLRVRAGNGTEWSSWSYSTSIDCSTVDGLARSWWVYSYTAPPGPIVIDGVGNQGGP